MYQNTLSYHHSESRFSALCKYFTSFGGSQQSINLSTLSMNHKNYQAHHKSQKIRFPNLIHPSFSAIGVLLQSNMRIVCTAFGISTKYIVTVASKITKYSKNQLSFHPINGQVVFSIDKVHYPQNFVKAIKQNNYTKYWQNNFAVLQLADSTRNQQSYLAMNFFSNSKQAKGDFSFCYSPYPQIRIMHTFETEINKCPSRTEYGMPIFKMDRGECYVVGMRNWPENKYFRKSDQKQIRRLISFERSLYANTAEQLIHKINFKDKLTELKLAKSSIADHGARLISTLDLPNLSKIDLDYNQITDRGAKQLCQAKWLNLLKIMLNGNMISDDGILCLIDPSVHSWPKIIFIEIDKNEMSQQLSEYIESIDHYNINRQQFFIVF